MVVPLSIQLYQALEERIRPLSDRSLNLMGDPYGSDSRQRVQAQHWIAYQGSDYPTGQGVQPIPAEGLFEQDRDLEFQHFVEIEDLRRDWQQAVIIHEWLLGAIAGFFPPTIPDARGPFRLVSDGVVSAKTESEVVYRYRASYKILCTWQAQDFTELFQPNEIRGGIFRSFIGEVAAESSVKDADGIVVLRPEEGG